MPPIISGSLALVSGVDKCPGVPTFPISYCKMVDSETHNHKDLQCGTPEFNLLLSVFISVF